MRCGGQRQERQGGQREGDAIGVREGHERQREGQRHHVRGGPVRPQADETGGEHEDGGHEQHQARPFGQCPQEQRVGDQKQGDDGGGKSPDAGAAEARRDDHREQAAGQRGSRQRRQLRRIADERGAQRQEIGQRRIGRGDRAEAVAPLGGEDRLPRGGQHAGRDIAMGGGPQQRGEADQEEDSPDGEEAQGGDHAATAAASGFSPSALLACSSSLAVNLEMPCWVFSQ